MKTALTAIALLATVSAVGHSTRAQTPPRTVLLIADDLHLDFRATPQVRALTARVLQALASDAAREALASTGTSQIFIAPTTEAASLEFASRSLVGNSLTFSQIVARRQQPVWQMELRYRAGKALESAADAITRVASGQNGQSFAVVYISNGDVAGDIPERRALIQTAVRSNAVVYAIDPRGLSNTEPPQGIDQVVWEAFLEETYSALAALAAQTNGTVAVTASEVDALLARLAKTGL
jgi:hypothetical protein